MSPSKPTRKGARGSRHAPPTNAFPKGHPGGPGRPKDDPEFIAACRERTPKALATLEAAMDNVENDPGPAVRAAEVLLNRAWGTAPSTIKLDATVKGDVKTDVGVRAELEMSPERVRNIAAVLRNAGALDALVAPTAEPTPAEENEKQG